MTKNYDELNDQMELPFERFKEEPPFVDYGDESAGGYYPYPDQGDVDLDESSEEGYDPYEDEDEDGGDEDYNGYYDQRSIWDDEGDDDGLDDEFSGQ